MIPAFGFSVGDFLAVLNLVGTVIDALRDSPYASSSIRSLINELYALESALIQVKRLDPDVGHNFEKIALQQAASQCQQTIDAFYGKIQKDQRHLQKGGTDSKIKDAWVKIKWTVCKKEDLEKFRAEIRGHTSSITVLLLALQMEATTIQTRKQESQQRSLAGRIQEFSSQAMGVLSTVTDNLAESIQQGKALLESSAQIVQTSLRIFQITYDIQQLILRIPGQIQRQQPVYLIDPFNKESPFHLEFVRSPEALLAVLKINLKESGCGPIMIDRGEFAIEESGTQRVVDLKAPWDICFYPGQKVAMSMVFKQQLPSITSSCPSCGTDHQETAEKEITCITCGTIFRRIQEVNEEESESSDSEDEPSPEDALERPASGPERPPKKGKRGEDSPSTNIQKFRRVQLMNTSSRYSTSRPINHEESWAAYDFEIHARNCVWCFNPYEVHRNHENLCEQGHRLAQDVAAFLFNRADGKTLSTVEEEDKLVRVKIPSSYSQVRGLLRAIESSLRHRSRTPFVSMGNFRVRSRPRAGEIIDWPPYQPKVEIDTGKPALKRGSLFEQVSAQREVAKKYSVEVREPSSRDLHEHRSSGYYR